MRKIFYHEKDLTNDFNLLLLMHHATTESRVKRLSMTNDKSKYSLTLSSIYDYYYFLFYLIALSL